MKAILAPILGAALAVPGPSSAATIRLADLLRTDELGYECIADANLELAFAATGKGLRVPRTCLPEPCDVLSRERLGHEVIGRPPDISEWDDYYARYAEYCRAETVAYGGTTAPPSLVQFWTPFVRGAGPVAFLQPNDMIARPSRGGSLPTGSGLTVLPGLGGSTPGTNGRRTTGPSASDEPAVPGIGPLPETPAVAGPAPDVPVGDDRDPTTDAIAAVPLPASLWLLALLLAGLTGGLVHRSIATRGRTLT